MMEQTIAIAAEKHADPADRATAEQALAEHDALEAQRLRAEAARVPPALDRNTGEQTGECACGCGRDVHPGRLALGYGLAIECAERRERSGRVGR